MKIEELLKLYDKNKHLFFLRLKKEDINGFRNYAGKISKRKLTNIINESISYLYLYNMIDVFIIRNEMTVDDYLTYKDTIKKYPTLLISSKYCDTLRFKVQDVISLMDYNLPIKVSDVKFANRLYDTLSEWSLYMDDIDKLAQMFGKIYRYSSVYLKSLLILKKIKTADEMLFFEQVINKYFYENTVPSGILYNILVYR